MRRPATRASVALPRPVPSFCLPPCAAFFSALAHLESIRASSVSLVSGRDQALGLELLDHASGLHTRALDAVLDWAQARCQEPDALLQVRGVEVGQEGLRRTRDGDSARAAAAT